MFFQGVTSDPGSSSGRVMSLLDNAARQSLRHSPFALAWRIVLAILGAVPSRFFPIASSVSDFKVPITLVGIFFFVVHFCHFTLKPQRSTLSLCRNSIECNRSRLSALRATCRYMSVC